MGDVIWSAPEDYRQSWKNSCWAAVLHAFCKGTPGRPKLTEKEIADFYDSETNRTWTFEDGTIKPEGFQKLLTEARFGMKTEQWDPETFTGKPDHMAQKLGSGWVILGYHEPKISGGHACLVYGIQGKKVHYLNPDASSGGLLKDDISYFKGKLKNGKLIVAWRSW